MTKPLSPAAQVLDAVCNNTEPDCDTQHIIAAALRAVADQVDAMNVPNHIQGDAYWPYRNGRDAAKEHFLAIAAELEAHPFANTKGDRSQLMFSVKQKREIADAVQQILQAWNELQDSSTGVSELGGRTTPTES